MPRLVNETPKYRKHKASGQAVVTIAGKDFYLGPWKSKASRIEYDRLIGEWLAAARPSVPTLAQSDISVAEIVRAFWKYAQRRYVKHGEATGTAENFRPALRLLNEIYGHTRAVDFRPLALKSLQARMIDRGNSRRYINENVARIQLVFRWAASEEMLPAAIAQSLETVPNLRKNSGDAKETVPIQPIDDKTVDGTLPHLPPIVADMVRLQRLTGMRPGEVCILRPCDVDTRCGGLRSLACCRDTNSRPSRPPCGFLVTSTRKTRSA